jgi:RNA polymerase sigma-70 factor, ECF subfamily
MPRTDLQELANNDAENLSLQDIQPAATDEELIAQVSHSDAIAFETLVNRYRMPALRLARRFDGLQNEAEDLVEEAFLRVYLRAHQYDPEAAPFKTWFFSILKNLCRNAARRNRSHSFVEFPEDAPAIDDQDRALARKEWVATLVTAIAKLPPNQREALLLRCEGSSYAEIAAALGVSVKSVDSLLARAKRTLRQKLTGGEKKSFD